MLWIQFYPTAFSLQAVGLEAVCPDLGVPVHAQDVAPLRAMEVGRNLCCCVFGVQMGSAGAPRVWGGRDKLGLRVGAVGWGLRCPRGLHRPKRVCCPEDAHMVVSVFVQGKCQSR